MDIALFSLVENTPFVEGVALAYYETSGFAIHIFCKKGNEEALANSLPNVVNQLGTVRVGYCQVFINIFPNHQGIK